MSKTQGFHILSLHVENVRGAKTITVYPKATGSVKITGKNGAGKSSVLDAIQYALGGKAAQPQKPIRHGETSAQVVADLGSLTVRRTWTEKSSYLTVEKKSQEGIVTPVPSPQAFLDELCGQGIGFDPLAFTMRKPADQVQMLLDVLSLPEDPRTLDAQRKALYDERTQVNRTLKQAEASAANAPRYPDAPAEEASLAVLLQEHNVRVSLKSQNDAKRRDVVLRGEAHKAARYRVEQLQSQLIDAEADLAEAAMFLEEAAAIAAALVDPDPHALDEQIKTLETTNARVRANQQHKRLADAAAVYQEQSDKLSASIESLDARKAAILTQATFPTPGLSISEDGKGGYGVTYNSVPLADCSSSEQLRVSISLSAALNPKVKVILVREGSLLDHDALATVEAWAVENGCQVWMEQVASENDGEGFFIVDGTVQEVAA